VRATWYSPRLRQEVSVARFGHYGAPLLLFPTAGGDAEECERMLMIRALSPLIDAGRLKVYSPTRSPARRGSTRGQRPPQGVGPEPVRRLRLQRAAAVDPQDCRSPTSSSTPPAPRSGPSTRSPCRSAATPRPSRAICMSGTFDLTGWMDGHHPIDFHTPRRPLPPVPRRRPSSSACASASSSSPVGEGRWETPRNSWGAALSSASVASPTASTCGARSHDHDWPTWREMLPKYLSEML
jgi:hypothetical protein